MGFLKFAPHAVIIAILSAILQYAAMVGGLKDYLIAPAVFQTWALYFLAGAKPLPGIKAVACGIVGALAAMLISVMGTSMAGGIGAQMAFTIAVLIVAFLCILMERVPPLNFIPAYFIGAGIYFLVPGDKNPMTFKLLQVAIALLCGFSLGFLTVLLRGRYAAMVEAKA